MTVPPLREELDLHPGPRLPDGQPTWTLHDPSRNQFYRIDWQTFCLLSHWHLGDATAICDAVSGSTTLHVEEEDVEGVVEFLQRNQLLQPHEPGSARKMAALLREQRGPLWKRVLHNYLFFRVPLVNPDPWLDRWGRLLEPFHSVMFLRITLAALVLGLVLVYRNWDQFQATLVDTISWDGMAAYGAALLVVKFLHELGHAFTAKRFGCRVPSMGVAFMVLWPMAYTDTNEVWKLSDARQRLTVAAAGVATETLVAIWATLAWALLPEGGPKAIAFVLATLSWFTTLALNLSPFMRFDGYFVVSDWLDLPNLHPRSFALARWDLRERLFDLGLPPPEHFPPRRHLGLILFAWGTWIYRLVLFIGIAALVYHFFIKLAGIFLFAVEIAWFILRPLWGEIQVWIRMWPLIRSRPRTRRTALLAVAFVLLFVLPWPTRQTASAHFRPAESLAVYAPAGAQVVELPWKDGDTVRQGATLVRLASADLQLRWDRASSRLAALRQQAAVAALDAALQQNLQVLQQEQASAEAELASVQAEAVRYQPVAPYDGTVRLVDPGLGAGQWLSRQERILTLVRPGAWSVEAWLDEEAVRRVEVGDGATFYADGLEGPFVPLRVVSIDPDATRVMPSRMLTVAAGGSVLAREKDGVTVPERSVYRVLLQAQGDPGALAAHEWRGRVVIRGSWEAPGLGYARSALALLWREAGF